MDVCNTFHLAVQYKAAAAAGKATLLLLQLARQTLQGSCQSWTVCVKHAEQSIQLKHAGEQSIAQHDLL